MGELGNYYWREYESGNRDVIAALGAEAGMMPLIEQYMRPIYLGLGFLVVPMIGNSAIRATGDTKSPSVIMMVAGGVNLVLDPLLIFTAGLGVAGAAWALRVADGDLGRRRDDGATRRGERKLPERHVQQPGDRDRRRRFRALFPVHGSGLR